MVFKGNLDIDPRGMIYESYRIEGISTEECRVIFLDWAIGAGAEDMGPQLQTLLKEYGQDHPNHPMTQVITEGLTKATQTGRRGGRNGRNRA